ncbi:hypothetical protein [Luteolibacter sp. AS25]|uniref:hypothetical protein n=1 Tax=Luteolibacter sp. AS25 TaxID=3135776 RepID=UPI00398A5846
MHSLTQWFESVETDRPFETCKACDQLLPLAADSWVVNKHYHRRECILEYAVCEKCRDEVSNRFSEESKARIREFLENEIDWENRIIDWMKLENPAERLDNCVACLTHRSLIDGFTLSAQFRHDGSLVDGALPLMLCSTCTGKVSEQLSPESQKVWLDFVSLNFEGPDSDIIGPGIF